MRACCLTPSIAVCALMSYTTYSYSRSILYVRLTTFASIFGKASVEIHLNLSYANACQPGINYKNAFQHAILFLHKHVRYLNENLRHPSICHVRIGHLNHHVCRISQFYMGSMSL
jgi:hypothetical protein